MRRMSVLAVFLIFALFPVSLAAQEATPELIDLPETTAPFGLGTTVLPSLERDIADLFALLPPEVAGEMRAVAERHDDGRIRATWGEDDLRFGPALTLQAIDFSRSDFFPPTWTAGIYVAAVAGVADYGTVAYGQDGGLVWIQAESSISTEGETVATAVASRPLYTLAWGQADSNWLFTASAFTPDGHAALAAAFVGAAGGILATPVATPG